MAQKPSHHPKAPGTYHAPKSDKPEYIQGETGLAGFGSRSFYVAQIPRVEANAVIKQHHYSRRIVANSYVHLGVFIDGVQVGVLQFGYALNPVAGATKIIEGTQVDQYLELNRMWLDDSAPRNSESRALSYAFKFIKRACPRVAWVQSFADERCGGWGIVYQAANFLYFGHHRKGFYELDGETYHEMLLTARPGGGGRAKYLRDNLERAVRKSLLQFRYIYLIRKNWLTRAKVPPLPYPKPGQPLPSRRRKKGVFLA